MYVPVPPQQQKNKKQNKTKKTKKQKQKQNKTNKQTNKQKTWTCWSSFLLRVGMQSKARQTQAIVDAPKLAMRPSLQWKSQV